MKQDVKHCVWSPQTTKTAARLLFSDDVLENSFWEGIEINSNIEKYKYLKNITSLII